MLVFLFMQCAASATDMPIKVGVSNPWSEYIKFLPDETSLPTFWSEEQLGCFWGTTLQRMVETKLQSLDREFTQFRNATKDIEWTSAWWDEDTGCASMQDWKVVDAMYRSRCMSLDQYGSSLVPVMDMANHTNLWKSKGMYATDPETKNVRLTLEEKKSLKAGRELTISYYSYKGACESLFSYGFFESDLENAQTIFLTIKPPDDDPLAYAKIFALDLKPALTIFMHKVADVIDWGSPLVWAMCVNEEDGLEIKRAKTVDGENELVVTWKGVEVHDADKLEVHIKNDPQRDLFKLRAHSIVRDRVEEEINKRMQEAQTRREQGMIDNDSHYCEMAETLRKLERALLDKAVYCLDRTVRFS